MCVLFYLLTYLIFMYERVFVSYGVDSSSMSGASWWCFGKIIFFVKGANCVVTTEKCIERQWMLRAVAKTVSGSEYSDWREASGSKRQCSKHPLWSKQVCLISPLSRGGGGGSVVLSISPHICTFCYIFVCLSLYCLFLGWILYSIYRPKYGG